MARVSDEGCLTDMAVHRPARIGVIAAHIRDAAAFVATIAFGVALTIWLSAFAG
jgi:hypothetical protein